MEPITHFLTGACIGRAGFNRKTAYATLAAVLAAEAADLDIVWGFAGPVEELKHHRGITHTLIAVPVVAGVIVGAVWLLSRWRRRKAKPRGPDAAGSTTARQPVHWGWLYLTTLVAALSHLVLDWTNNYGVRPLFPFNPRWYEGSIVFIAEPVLWGLFSPWSCPGCSDLPTARSEHAELGFGGGGGRSLRWQGWLRCGAGGGLSTWRGWRC
jgi:inner membrane protein